MIAALLSLAVAIAGGAMVFLVMRRHGWGMVPSLALGVALAPGAGFGVLSLVFFFWRLPGLDAPGPWPLIGLTALVMVVIAVPVYRKLERPSRSDIGPRREAVAMAVLVAMAFGLLVWSFPRVREAQPFGGFDAKAIWNVRGFFLYRTDGDLAETFSQLRFGHPDYPLLLPGAAAAQYSILGGDRPAAPQVTGLLFTLGVGALLFVAVAKVTTWAVAGAAVAVLWTTPSFWRWGFLQYADIPLSYLLLAAAFLLASQLEDDEIDRLPPSLAGLFLGLLSWVKNEGLILVGILSIAFGLAWVLARGWRRGLGHLAWIAAGAAPALTALVAFKRWWSPENETARFLELEKLFVLERWWTVAGGFWRELSPLSGVEGWGLLWPFVAAIAVFALCRRWPRRPPIQMMGLAVAMAWSGWFAVYVLTPHDITWHLDSSLRRLMLQLTPLTLACVLSAAGRPPSETLARGSA